MKVRPSVKPMRQRCRVIKRHGRTMVICTESPAQATAGLGESGAIWHALPASTSQTRSGSRSA